MSPKEKVIDLVRKLMAKAESTADLGNKAEAAAFAKKVTELMQKHKLDETDITPEEINASKVVYKMVHPRDFNEPVKRARSAWREDLAYVISTAHLCRIRVREGSNYIWFLGVAEDVEVATSLFCNLAPRLERLAEKEYNSEYWRAEKLGLAHRMKGWKRSFLMGAVAGVRDVLREQQEWLKNQNKGTALIRLTREALDKFEEDNKMSKSNAAGIGPQRLNSDAVHRGYHAGRQEAGHTQVKK